MNGLNRDQKRQADQERRNNDLLRRQLESLYGPKGPHYPIQTGYSFNPSLFPGLLSTTYYLTTMQAQDKNEEEDDQAGLVI